MIVIDNSQLLHFIPRISHSRLWGRNRRPPLVPNDRHGVIVLMHRGKQRKSGFYIRT